MNQRWLYLQLFLIILIGVVITLILIYKASKLDSIYHGYSGSATSESPPVEVPVNP